MSLLPCGSPLGWLISDRFELVNLHQTGALIKNPLDGKKWPVVCNLSQVLPLPQPKCRYSCIMSGRASLAPPPPLLLSFECTSGKLIGLERVTCNIYAEMKIQPVAKLWHHDGSIVLLLRGGGSFGGAGSRGPRWRAG